MRKFSTASLRRRRLRRTRSRNCPAGSAALKAPEMAPKLAAQGLFPVGACGAPFGAYMQRQFDEYSPRSLRGEYHGQSSAPCAGQRNARRRRPQASSARAHNRNDVPLPRVSRKPLSV